MRRFVRIREGKVLMGVATGLAVYFHLDVVLVRIALLALAIIPQGGFGAVTLYLLLGFLTPIVLTPADANADH